MKLKDTAIYVAVLVLSVVFLFVGNRLTRVEADDTAYQFDSRHYTGVVTEIVERHEQEIWGANSTTVVFDVRLTTRGRRGDIVTADQLFGDFELVSQREVSVGDRVVLFYASWDSNYHFSNYARINNVVVFGAIFLLLVILFGRTKGFNAIIALGFTCMAVFLVFVPAILSGRNIYITTIVICGYAIITTILIVVGSNKKALAAILGCLGGVLLAGLSMVSMDLVLRLTGALDRETEMLLLLPTDPPIDLRAIIFAGVILGAVGAIMDVAMSISSSLWEVKEAGGISDLKNIFKSGTAIGKDIFGTMLNTLILAYIGSSLSLILLLNANSVSLTNLFNMEMIIVELLRALVGSFGMLMTIPLTAAICGWFYTRSRQNAVDKTR